MLSWKALMAFALFLHVLYRFLHSNSCISLTGVQLGLLVAG